MTDGAIRHRTPHPEDRAKCGGCRLQDELTCLREEAAKRKPVTQDSLVEFVVTRYRGKVLAALAERAVRHNIIDPALATPSAQGTICKCGLAKSYHGRPTNLADHEWEPRYLATPSAQDEGTP